MYVRERHTHSETQRLSLLALFLSCVVLCPCSGDTLGRIDQSLEAEIPLKGTHVFFHVCASTIVKIITDANITQ